LALAVAVGAGVWGLVSSCGNNGAVSAGGAGGSASGGPEDVSASGAAGTAVGGALAMSSASGTVTRRDWLPEVLGIPSAYASTACPTVTTAVGLGCTQLNTAFVALSYGNCSFGLSEATWNGILAISGGTVTCGTFPTGSISRQYVSNATLTATPSVGTRTSEAGTSVTIDHVSPNLTNYQGDTIAASIASPSGSNGYGVKATIAGGVRTGITVNQRLFAGGKFDHTVTGSVTVTEVNGATSRTVTGTMTVYHNLLRVEGQSTFNSVLYSNQCCAPTGGNIKTQFFKTSNSGAAGVALDGKFETLTFTGCGSATFVDTGGNQSTVSMTGCY
jgi:hypothetical protein